MLLLTLGIMLMAAPADEGNVRSTRTAQNAAIAAGDLDRVASFWTEDVTVRRALGQPLSGKQAARKALEPAPAPATHLVYLSARPARADFDSV